METGRILYNKITEDKMYLNMTSSEKNTVFCRLWDTATFCGHLTATPSDIATVDFIQCFDPGTLTL
jgi:hypothetical protein